MIYGDADLTWQSALIFTKTGESIAIIGRFELETARNVGAYSKVLPYDESIKPVLLQELERLKPKQIAINTSESDVLADGLTHGMYLNLLSLLEGDTPFADRLISAEHLLSSLRGRKSKLEIDADSQSRRLHRPDLRTGLCKTPTRDD